MVGGGVRGVEVGVKRAEKTKNQNWFYSKPNQVQNRKSQQPVTPNECASKQASEGPRIGRLIVKSVNLAPRKCELAGPTTPYTKPGRQFVRPSVDVHVAASLQKNHIKITPFRSGSSIAVQSCSLHCFLSLPLIL